MTLPVRNLVPVTVNLAPEIIEEIDARVRAMPYHHMTRREWIRDTIHTALGVEKYKAPRSLAAELAGFDETRLPEPLLTIMALAKQRISIRKITQHLNGGGFAPPPGAARWYPHHVQQSIMRAALEAGREGWRKEKGPS